MVQSYEKVRSLRLGVRSFLFWIWVFYTISKRKNKKFTNSQIHKFTLYNNSKRKSCALSPIIMSPISAPSHSEPRTCNAANLQKNQCNHSASFQPSSGVSVVLMPLLALPRLVRFPSLKVIWQLQSIFFTFCNILRINTLVLKCEFVNFRVWDGGYVIRGE